MDSAALRIRVWEEMLLAEMRANYFAEYALRYQNLDRWIRIGVLLASCGATATALPSADPAVKLGLPIIAAAGSLWALVYQFGMLARDASGLHIEWAAIHTEYERLWCHLDKADAEDLFHSIYAKGNALSVNALKFPNRKERLGELLDDAARMASARYA